MPLYSGQSQYGPSSRWTRYHNENVMMELALGANPWLGDDPQSLMAIAQSGADPEDIMMNASAIAGVQTIDTLGETLSGLTPVAQRSVYSKLTEQQQRALAHMGYKTPQEPKKGWFDDTPLEGAWDVAADVTSIATRPVGLAMEHVGGRALDMLAWVGDVPAHFYRAIRQMEGWQQWLALGGAAALVALTGGTALGAFAGMGTLAQIGALGGTALAGGILATAPTAITNPSEWWDVMNPFGRTGVRRGERIFSQGAQAKAREILGGAEIFETLARDVAVGMDAYDIASEFAGVANASSESVMLQSLERVAKQMADPGTVEYQQVFTALQTLMEQPEFREAVDTLQNGKMSFGRDVASALQLDPGDFGYGLVSGSADALWLVTMDPMLAMGKLGKVQRLWRRGMDTPTGPDAIARLADMYNDDPAIRGVMTQVIDAVDRGSFRAMPKQWRPLFRPMQEFKNAQAAKGLYKEGFDAEAFFDYIRTGDGLKQISRGKATVKGIESIVISAQNSGQGWSKFVESVRRFQKGMESSQFEHNIQRIAKGFGVEADLDKALPRNFMDHAVDMKFDLHDFKDAERVVYGELTKSNSYIFGREVGKGLLVVPGGRSLSNFLTGITTMIPASSALKLTGSSADDYRDMAEDIPRFVEAMGKMMNIPAPIRDEWLDTIMIQDNVAMRRNAVLSFMDSIFAATGWHATDEMKTIADDFIMKYKQAYALGGTDTLMTPLGERILGVYPELHSAVYMVMPDAREMTKLVRQGHILKHVAKLVDNNMVEQAMSRVIKPGWLMRIGFIPRAAGEEMLAFWLRMSEGGLIQEFAGRSVAKRNIFKQAQRELAEVGGDWTQLNPATTRALEDSLPAHLKPLAAIGRRTAWAKPTDELLSKWADFQAQAFRSGLNARFTKHIPDWADELLLGRRQSVRRMVLNGVDPVLVEAGEKFMRNHSAAIMRANSAAASSVFERQVVAPDAAHIVQYDAANPDQRKDTLIRFTGERGRVGTHDIMYRNGVWTSATDWSKDRVLMQAMLETAPGLRPASVHITDEQLYNMYDKLRGVTRYETKQLLSELLSFDDANFRAAVRKLGQKNPKLAEALQPAAFHGRFDFEEFSKTIDALRARRVKEQATAVGWENTVFDVSYLDINEYMDLLAIRDELKEAMEVIAGMGIFDDTTQSWTAMKASEFLASPDPEKLMLAASSGAGVRPKNVLYRGVSSRQVHFNSDGSITIYPTSQGQWAGGKRAVSMTTDPNEATIYATQHVQNDTGTDRLATGLVLELDGDYLAATYNQDWNTIRSQGRSYRDGPDIVREDGLRFIGQPDSPATEVALVTGDGWITIPPGHWRTQTTDEMRALAANPGEGQWMERLQGIQFDIKGHSVQDVADALSTKIESLQADPYHEADIAFFKGADRLADETGDKDILRATWRERQGEYRDYLQNQFEEGAQKPDPIFGDYILGGPRPEIDADDEFANKIYDFLDSEVLPGLSVREAMQAFLKGKDNNPYAADDLFQGMTGSGAYLFRSVEEDYYGNEVFGQASDALTALYGAGKHGFGRGGFEDMQQWAPFHQSFDDFREALINNVVAQLNRPENQDLLKMAEQSLHAGDGTVVARPPADGTARIYTAVVPPDSSNVERVLDSWYTERGGEVSQVLDQLESIAFNPTAYDGDPLMAMDDLLDQLLLNSDLGGAELDAFGPFFAEAEKYRIEDELMPDGSYMPGAAAFPEPDSDEYWELVDMMQQGLDKFRGPSFEEAARRLIDSSSWVNADELVGLTDEEKVQYLAYAIRHYRASRSRYQLSMSQALDGVAFDDPRIARWVSNIMSGDATQMPRVGMIPVPRNAPRKALYGGDGLRMRGRNETYGGWYDVHEMYRNQAIPMDAQAMSRVGYTYTDYRGNPVQAYDTVVGLSVDESVRQYAEIAVDSMLGSIRRGVSEAQVYAPKGERTTQVARRLDNRFEPLQPGETMYSKEDLVEIDETGEVIGTVKFGDNRYFDHDIREADDDLMWNVIAPVLRDKFELDSGLGLFTTKQFAEESGFASKPLTIESSDLRPESTVRLTRSRVDDLDKEPSSALPNVAIQQIYEPVPDRIWDRIVRFGFDKIIGPSIDALARKPMSFHYYAAAYADQKKYGSWMLDQELFDNQIPEMFPELFAWFDEGAAMQFSDEEMIRVRAAFRGLTGKDTADDEAIIKYFANSYRADPMETVAELEQAADINYTMAWARVEEQDPLVKAFNEDVQAGIQEEIDAYIEYLTDGGMDVPESLYNIVDYTLRPDGVPNDLWDQWVAEAMSRSSQRDEFAELIYENDWDERVARLVEGTEEYLMHSALIQVSNDLVNNPGRFLPKYSLRDDGRQFAEVFVEDIANRLPIEAWDSHAALNAALKDEGINLHTSWEQYTTLKAAAENLRHVTDLASETALYRAIENVIPFLDSHEQRSLFAEYGRNFIPFWYAEENFIKRWSRTFALGEFGIPGRKALSKSDRIPNWAKSLTIPSMGLDQLRKAQLTYMGLRSAGIVRTDANGEDWIVYPGSGLLTEVVEKIPGLGDVQPMGVLMAASTDSLLPGVSPDNTITPSPFIGVPMTFVAHMFPEAKGVKDAMLGPIGSQRGILDQFVPSMAGGMWEAVFGNEDSSVRYASAMMAAISYAEAEGRGLPDNATGSQIEEYLDRMRNHARIIMVSQALVGYVVPGAPRALPTDSSGMSWLTGVGIEDPEEITSEMYRTYIKNLGIEEGTAAFLREFEHADLEDVINPLAFTASGTTSVSGAPLPATKLGMRWYEDNQSWIDQSPEAGAWFLPQDGSDEFEYTAYRQQLVSGLRKRRTPEEFIRSLKFRSASTDYFEVKDVYEEMLLGLGNDAVAKRNLDDKWERWKTQYLAAHPIFAEELQNGRSKLRRGRTVEQMRYAVSDPSAPDSPYKDAIKDMVEVFDVFQGKAKLYREDGSAQAKEKLRELRDRFENFGEQWAIDNPEVSRLWSSVYRIEAGIK